MRWLASTYKLVVSALLGAQLFFAAVAAQRIFPPEVAALPRGDPRRTLAADLVGQLLGSLDSAAMLGGALCVLLALQLSRRLAARPAAARAALRAATPALLVVLCATASSFGTTPAIHAMREAGRTGEARFGVLHGLSSGLLLLEMALLLFAALRRLEVDEPA